MVIHSHTLLVTPTYLLYIITGFAREFIDQLGNDEMLEEKQALGALSIPMDPTLAVIPNQNQNQSSNNNNNDLMSLPGSAAGSVASLATVFKSRCVLIK